MPKYSKRKIGRLLKQSDEAPNVDLKGDLFEELVCYLFEKVPGISFTRKNVLDQRRAHELDLAFWNNQPKSSLFFLDPTLIIECKNTGDPVGSGEVSWYVRKLRASGANSGILVSSSGITGTEDGVSSAHSEVLNALSIDRIKIILINREEILHLNTTDDLIQMITSKYLRLTLRREVE